MPGQRLTRLIPLILAPGYYSNATDRMATGRFTDGNRVRFHKGMPEKIGGWERISITGTPYAGTCRAITDWVSLDTQKWLALGTESKVYLVNNLTLYDITPLRKSSNVTNPFTTSNGLKTVTVHDVDHRANPLDYITIVGGTAVGGITLSGSYQITSVTDPDNYVITAATAAGSGATGGGSLTIQYDINAGLAQNGELLGYGTSTYGSGTYGTPRAAGTGVPAKLRAWSLHPWGEDLVAAYNDGELYWWDRTSGSSARAQLVNNAPKNVQHMVVDDKFRRVILFGCNDTLGHADKLDVRWCSIEDINDWELTESNTAGEYRLDHGSRLITAIRSFAGILCWTDTQIYSVSATSASTYDIVPKGNCSIAGQNAQVDVNGTVFFMGTDGFYVYDGVLSRMECDVYDHVFGDINLDQTEKIFASTYRFKKEVRWEYQSASGTECDRYVVFNYELNCWYFGKMNRTAYREPSDAVDTKKSYPFGANGGYLYRHEKGTDEVEGSTTTPMDWYLQTAYNLFRGNDISIISNMVLGGSEPGVNSRLLGSDVNVLMNQFVPDFVTLTVGMNVTMYSKTRPQQADYQTSGPYYFDSDDTDVNCRAKGSQISFKWTPALDLNTGAVQLGQAWRMGIWQFQGVIYGGR